MKHKSSSISTFHILTRTFILFSIGTVLSYILATSFFSVGFDSLLDQKLSSYFASETFSETSARELEAAGGWAIIVDQNLSPRSRYGEAPEQFNSTALLQLASQRFSYRGQLYAGTISRCKSGNYVICALPSEMANISYTLNNPPGSLQPAFILLFALALLLFLFLYTIVLFFISKILMRKIVTPINEITLALEKMYLDQHSSYLHRTGNQEFHRITDALNKLFLKLDSVQNMRNSLHEEKVHILSSIGHDIRTPLSIISGSLFAVLSHGNLTKNDDRTEALLQDAYQASLEIKELVSYQMDFANSSLEGNGVTLSGCSLSEILRTNIIENLSLAEAGHVHIEMEIPEEAYIQSNPICLKRIIHLLLLNSISASPVDSLIRIELRETNGNWQLLFSDQHAFTADEKETCLEILRQKKQSQSGSASDSRSQRSVQTTRLSILKSLLDALQIKIGVEENCIFQDVMFERSFILTFDHSS